MPRDTAWGGKGWIRGWKRTRQTILKRDRYLCVHCKAKGILTPATDVDHITPREQGGTEDHDNLQSLCHRCHADKSAEDRGAKPIRKVGRDGYPVP